jgi:hypothetical protein
VYSGGGRLGRLGSKVAEKEDDMVVSKLVREEGQEGGFKELKGFEKFGVVEVLEMELVVVQEESERLEEREVREKREEREVERETVRVREESIEAVILMVGCLCVG